MKSPLIWTLALVALAGLSFAQDYYYDDGSGCCCSSAILLFALAGAAIVMRTR